MVYNNNYVNFLPLKMVYVSAYFLSIIISVYYYFNTERGLPPTGYSLTKMTLTLMNPIHPARDTHLALQMVHCLQSSVIDVSSVCVCVCVCVAIEQGQSKGEGASEASDSQPTPQQPQSLKCDE